MMEFCFSHKNGLYCSNFMVCIIEATLRTKRYDTRVVFVAIVLGRGKNNVVNNLAEIFSNMQYVLMN
jgi:hypothetical protein